MTQKQRQAYADAFAKRLGLSGWEIHWTWVPGETFGEGNYGQVQWNVRQMYATVTVAVGRPDASVQRTVRHELVHLAMALLHEAEKAVLKQAGGCGACETWLDVECEKLTEAIASAFDES